MHFPPFSKIYIYSPIDFTQEQTREPQFYYLLSQAVDLFCKDNDS